MQIHSSTSKSTPPTLGMCHCNSLGVFLCLLCFSIWCLYGCLFPHVFFSHIPFSYHFLPRLDLRFPTIHLTWKKGLRTNSSPGDQQDWDWVLCAEIQDNCVTPGMRAEGLLIIGRERETTIGKSSPTTVLSYFPFSFYPPPNPVLTTLPNPLLILRGEKPKETEVVAASRREERGGSSSCRIEAHVGASWELCVCLEEENVYFRAPGMTVQPWKRIF